MGKKLNSLLGKKTFKSSKFKARLFLAISRLAILKFQRQARYTHACSDIAKLLEIGQIQRALLRVERVIKEQNMFDVLVMIEEHCNLLIERVRLIKLEGECPDELKEPISSLIYAASRCGDFPELQKICRKLTKRYGKEFAASAIELHHDCGVSPEMIQKLSTKLPSLENRLKMLHEIASENNIILPLEGASSVTEMIQHLSTRLPGLENKVKVLKGTTSDNNIVFQRDISPEDRILHKHGLSVKFDNFNLEDHAKMPEDMEDEDGPSDSMGIGRKYKDAAAAAQAAYQSAAIAAAAARAAIELSRTGPPTPDDSDSPTTKPGKAYQRGSSSVSHSGSENEEVHYENEPEELQHSRKMTECKQSISSLSLDSEDMYLDEKRQAQLLQKDIHFDDSDDDDDKNIIEQMKTLTSKLNKELKRNFSDGGRQTRKTSVVRFEDLPSSDSSPSGSSPPKMKPAAGHLVANAAKKPEAHHATHIDIDKKPISMRSRKHWGQ